MKLFDNTKRSRLKALIFFGLITAGLTGYTIFKEMEGPALAGLAGLAAIVAMYMNGETNRPSLKS